MPSHVWLFMTTKFINHCSILYSYFKLEYCISEIKLNCLKSNNWEVIIVGLKKKTHSVFRG